MTRPMRVVMWTWVLLMVGIGTGYAQEETPPPAPADVKAMMPPGSESLWFGKYPIGPKHQMVMVHFYRKLVSEKAKGNADSQDGTVFSLPKSIFTSDFLVRERGKIKRLNRVTFRGTFRGEGHLFEMKVKWLEPKVRRGPVIATHFGVSDGGEWWLMVFPDGIPDKVTVQNFIYGGEGDSGNSYSWDRVDRHGKMIVREDWNEGKKEGVHWYPWDGVEFANRYEPYLVIAASTKTHAKAEAFLLRNKDLEGGLVRPSDHYPNLRPGYYIVIADRFDNRKGAEEYAGYLRKEGTDCYVKRAF